MAPKILFITLSNIGDVILTLPVLDGLREKFPGAQITVVCGEKGRGIFELNPLVHKFIAYDKRAGLKEKIRLFNSLRKEKFDVVVDLRNSLFGALLPAKYKTSPLVKIPGRITHMKERHLYKIKKILAGQNAPVEVKSLCFNPSSAGKVDRLLKENDINEKDRLVVISAAAGSHTKRWPKEKFVELIGKITKDFTAKIILIGDKQDIELNRFIAQNAQAPVLDLAGKTTLDELAYLLKRAGLLVSNDSAALHMASYLNIPVVGIFGITDDAKYGPWSEKSRVVKKEIFCRPCRQAQCKFGTLECMTLVKTEDVFRAVKEILFTHYPLPITHYPEVFKRILIVRTDRIGDVLLTTPAIKALRDRYPQAYIAMMVSPYAKDIVEGNPYLDKVIILDKDKAHRNWLGSINFIRKLKKERFDLALIFHPTNRVHLLTFLSAIPKRAGYARKWGFLLTDKIKHLKQLGEKHELEYNLDLLNHLGIQPQDKKLFMPLKAESEKWAEGLLRGEGVKVTDKLLALNPAASCPSKIWPAKRFAQAAENIAQKYGFKILVIAGGKDLKLAEDLIKHMRSTAINLAGKTSLSQLASLLKRCSLFISNDSGPVHIASAVGTPVISIFGRNQAGLSPKRWGPVGARDKIVHKASCIECLAHNCQKEFACLKAISVDDLVAAVDSILEH